MTALHARATLPVGEDGRWVVVRDSRKSRQNGKKTRVTFVKIAKITAKTRHQIMGLKTIIQSIECAEILKLLCVALLDDLHL